MTRSQASDLIAAASGLWIGEEEIVIDQDRTIRARARFENRAALQGRGLSAAYVQEADGAEILACHSVFRFGPEGQTTMTWLPSDGAAQLAYGHLTEGCIEVSWEADGVIQSLTADYRVDGHLTQTMKISPPGAPSVVVFRGEYRKVAP